MRISTLRASGATSADVSAVLVECHRFGSAAVDLVATTLDLGAPQLRGVGLGFAVEAADQLECQTRTLLRREAKNVCKDAGRSHAKYVNRCSTGVIRLRAVSRNISATPPRPAALRRLAYRTNFLAHDPKRTTEVCRRTQRFPGEVRIAL